MKIEIYAQSLEVQMVSELAEAGTPVNWPLMGGIVGVVVVIASIVALTRRRVY